MRRRTRSPNHPRTARLRLARSRQQEGLTSKPITWKVSLHQAASEQMQIDLTECINQMVLESQIPRNIAIVLFMITSSNSKLTFFVGELTFENHPIN